MRQEAPKYIPTEPYKRLISILRSYKDDVAELDKLTDDGSKRYAELSRRVNAVRKCLDRLTEEQRVVLEQNLLNGVALIYCYTTRAEFTVKLWRKKFLLDLAKELGEI